MVSMTLFYNPEYVCCFVCAVPYIHNSSIQTARKVSVNPYYQPLVPVTFCQLSYGFVVLTSSLFITQRTVKQIVVTVNTQLVTIVTTRRKRKQIFDGFVFQPRCRAYCSAYAVLYFRPVGSAVIISVTERHGSILVVYHCIIVASELFPAFD